MPWCEPCDRWFNTDQALWQHEDYSSVHNICHSCNKLDFPTPWGLTQHYVQSRLHAYCQDCNRHFDDFADLHDHNENDHYYCSICNTIFDFEVGLHEHRRQKHANAYCVSCKRMFQSENNLRQHQRSTVHQGRTVMCPMKNCGRSFPSTAALVLHLESGTCTSGMNRAIVNRFISDIDRTGVITNPSRLIEGPQVTKTWATERTWNGSYYECYLCHHMFGALLALNAHLQSPAHGDKLYRCPNVWRGCGTEFRTLSAFFQHVESGRCDVVRFKPEMDRFVEGLSMGAKRLTAG